MTKLTKPETMNAAMIDMIPELDSEYSKAPMAGNRWYKLTDVLDNGSPCFIPCDKPVRRKIDYIWVPEAHEKRGWFGNKKKQLHPGGYYHLRTREAYVWINAVLKSYKKKRFLAIRVPQSKLTKAEKDVIYLMKLRLHSLIPDDVHAARTNHFNKGLDGDLAETFFNTAALASVVASVCHS